jgi:hypothetical protein
MIPAVSHIDVDLSVFSAPQRRELTKLLEGIKRSGDAIIGSLDSLPMNPVSATPALRALLTQAQGSIPANAFEGWHEIGSTLEPPFAHSWVNNGGGAATAAYRKFPDGLVKLKGLIKSGTLGLTAFTLPVGYRPSTTHYFGVGCNVGTGAIGILTVDANGGVIPSKGSNVDFSIECAFKAAA